MHTATPRRPAGFTLTELLVVIAIILLISVATLPMALVALSEREVSDAASTVQANFAVVQSRAVASGQAQGIRLLPDPTLNGLLAVPPGVEPDDRPVDTTRLHGGRGHAPAVQPAGRDAGDQRDLPRRLRAEDRPGDRRADAADRPGTTTSARATDPLRRPQQRYTHRRADDDLHPDGAIDQLGRHQSRTIRERGRPDRRHDVRSYPANPDAVEILWSSNGRDDDGTATSTRPSTASTTTATASSTRLQRDRRRRRRRSSTIPASCSCRPTPIGGESSTSGTEFEVEATRAASSLRPVRRPGEAYDIDRRPYVRLGRPRGLACRPAR